jgi:hypothetical protein
MPPIGKSVVSKPAAKPELVIDKPSLVAVSSSLLRADWQMGKVEIIYDNLSTGNVEGFVSSGCIVWNGVRGKWNTTLLRSRYTLTIVDTPEDAKRVAEYAWSRFCLALRLETREAVVAKLPKWVGFWCVKMKLEGKWLDPREFEENPDYA